MHSASTPPFGRPRLCCGIGSIPCPGLVAETIGGMHTHGRHFVDAYDRVTVAYSMCNLRGVNPFGNCKTDVPLVIFNFVVLLFLPHASLAALLTTTMLRSLLVQRPSLLSEIHSRSTRCHGITRDFDVGVSPLVIYSPLLICHPWSTMGCMPSTIPALSD